MPKQIHHGRVVLPGESNAAELAAAMGQMIATVARERGGTPNDFLITVQPVAATTRGTGQIEIRLVTR